LVVGIDINRQNLLICKKTRAELILCDIENLPIRDTAIDALECVATLEHVPSPWRAVKEASRVLRRDEGLAFITFPHYEWTKAVNDSKIAWKLVLSLRDLICDLTCILIPVAVRRAIFNINLIGFRTYGRTCHAGFSFQSILRIYRDAHMQVVEANWCPAQQLLEVIASPK
jgi:SAM-dependent methyltransferase